MNSQGIKTTIDVLSDWFRKIGKCTIATSGGIDSMVLAYIAHQALKRQVLIAHSTSISVPSLDAKRVRLYSKKYQWQLKLIEANELNNESYRNNPVNRCYFCKTSLFCQLKQLNHGVLITGTNQDDLGDYRPGLIAAKEHGVRQPYVELGIDKATIRLMAGLLQLNDLKDIPASPCLSSRIETGIEINPEHLLVVDKVENYVRNKLNTDTVRFRIRNDKVALELEPNVLDELSNQQKDTLISQIKQMINTLTIAQCIEISSYKKGSAFIGVKQVE